MSEFKKGDRVLVEAEISAIGKTYDENLFYKVEINNSIGMEQPSIIVDKVYPIPTKTYEDGLREAWDLARRIALGKEHGGFSLAELEKIFKVERRKDVFMLFTPQKAAECIALWEARSKFNVRDQVRYGDTNHLGVVMKVVGKDDDMEYYVWWSSGSSSYERANNLAKTGRTVDVAAFLAQIGGTE